MSDLVPLRDGVATVAVRLLQARLTTGLSTREVTKAFAKQFPNERLSHTSVARYEKGQGIAQP